MAPPELALEAHRPALTGHCYRMLGSIAEADDAVQETLLRAWRGLSRFEGRAALRTWLFRIATRVCLDALADRSVRASPADLSPAGTVDDPLAALPAERWLQPAPDAAVIPAGADPAERAVLRESVRLAFVAALQALPPRQRAALLLADVLELSAAEIAETLDTTVPAVNSALQRARATLAARPAGEGRELSDGEERLLARYVAAFERYDVDALLALLREDVVFSMPPYALWLRGRAAVGAWLLGRGAACRGSRLVPTAACGQPAFAQYKPGGRAWALAVLETSEGGISAWTSFLDVERLFPRFGLPVVLPPDEARAPAAP